MKANQNFHQQDMEMFAMVNEKTAARRRRREALELACIEEAELPVVQNNGLQIAAGVTVRGGLGLIVAGGVVRGLVDPVFGIVMTAMCLIWAWGYCRRSRNGN
jgi:hypothetical protein